jgi:hypothetical protein
MRGGCWRISPATGCCACREMRIKERFGEYFAGYVTLVCTSVQTKRPAAAFALNPSAVPIDSSGNRVLTIHGSVPSFRALLAVDGRSS